MDTQGPRMATDGLWECFQFLQRKVGLAQLQPILGGANGKGLVQSQSAFRDLVEVEGQLLGLRFGVAAAFPCAGETASGQADDETDRMFDIHADSLAGGVRQMLSKAEKICNKKQRVKMQER